MSIASALKNTILKRFATPEDFKLITVMFLPILVEQLLITMMGTVHTVMLSKVGTAAISAVGLVDQINQFAFSFFTSVSVGATVVISQYVGARKPVAVKSTAEQAVVVGTVVSTAVAVIFVVLRRQVFDLFFGQTEKDVFELAMIYLFASALSFPFISLSTTSSGIMRGTGDTRSPMVISIIMGIVNVVFSAVTIFGFGLGVYGAAASLVLSRLVGAGAGIALLIRKKHLRGLRYIFRIRPRYIVRIFRIGMLVGAESMIFMLGKIMTQSYFVAEGTNHIAANTIASSIFGIVAIPGNSMAVITTTLAGIFTGSGDKAGARRVVNSILYMTIAMQTALCLLIIPPLGLITSLYTEVAEIAHLSRMLILTNCVAMPLFWSVVMVYMSGMKGAGDVVATTVISMGSMWVFRVYISYLLGSVLHMGVIGVWLGMYTDWVVRAVIAFFRFRSGKWLKKTVIS
ncbi:MAG: MATE family efflux transporter [Eubacteriales bacterium]